MDVWLGLTFPLKFAKEGGRNHNLDEVNIRGMREFSPIATYDKEIPQPIGADS